MKNGHAGVDPVECVQQRIDWDDGGRLEQYLMIYAGTVHVCAKG